MKRASVICLSVGLVLLAVSPVRGNVIITLGAGVTNPPASLTSKVPETAVADTAQLVTSANFNAILAATLMAQEFTSANNWVYSFNAKKLPPGIVNPVALPTVAPNNARFNITEYHLSLNLAQTAFGETMKFTLVNPPADPVLAGAKITEHWLQLLNEDQPYNHFGFAIARRQGFWELDNGDKAPGDGPFYDSNGGNIVPPTFLDTPGPIEGIGGVSGIGAYLHFTTIPSWDVLVGATNYAIVGDTGITWGFTVVPEPSTIILVGVGIVLITIVARFQRTRALSSKKG